jgi:hypothetical protein
MRLLSELAAAIPYSPYAVAILQQARRLAAACAHDFPDAERDQLNELLGAVEQTVAATAA